MRKGGCRVIGPNTLVLDIENFPATFTAWRTGQQSVSLAQMVSPGGIIGVGYQWADKSRAKWIDNRDADMVEKVWNLLDQADEVVGYNSDNFDLKHLNRDFAKAGLGEPSPAKGVDLYKVIRRKFAGESGKLDWAASTFLGEHKMDTGGYGLWRGVAADDPAAWRKMAAYCRKDVEITTKLYHFLKDQGWVTGLHRGLVIGDPECCPGCGSTSRQSRGTAYTAQSSYPQYRCNDCGKWYRGTGSLERAKTTGVK